MVGQYRLCGCCGEVPGIYFTAVPACALITETEILPTGQTIPLVSDVSGQSKDQIITVCKEEKENEGE